MFAWLARRVVKDAWVVVATWLVVAAVSMALALTGVGGTGLFDRLESATASVPESQSQQGDEILDTLTGDATTVSLLVRNIDISDTAEQEKIATALAPAHKELTDIVGEANVLDPFVVPGMLAQPAALALAAKNLDGFLMVVTVDPNGEEVVTSSDPNYKTYIEQRDEQVAKVIAALREVPGDLKPLAPKVSGIVSDDSLMSQAINNQVHDDLVHGEIVSLPISLFIMVLVFGGFLLAGMPLLGALASIAATLGVMWVLSGATTLYSFVVNIVTVIGLGLSIDYALLFTSRYREELAKHGLDGAGAGTAEAGAGSGASGAGSHGATRHLRRRRRVRRDGGRAMAIQATMATAGRTVAFSGLTVAVSLLALFLAGTDVLHNIAMAGLAVVLIAVAAALTLVPAVLYLLGDRLRKPSPLGRVPLIGRIQRHLGDVASEKGFFSALAGLVHRMPWVVLTGCAVILVILASPVRGLHLLSSTEELLPPNSDQRAYVAALREDYPAAQNQDATLIISATGEKVTAMINNKVAKTPGVKSVIQSATAGDYTVVYLDLVGDGTTKADEDAVVALRHLTAPADFWVTGQAAHQVDFREAMASGLPKALGAVVLITFILLFLMTGSVLVPLKALIINSLSLAASLGVLTWIFQEGHGVNLLGFTPIGGLESYVVVTALGVGFGLAMDYEVFILARIKEYWDAGETNDVAVEKGLQRSGRIVTSAATVMVAVFLGFVSGDLLVIKEVGVALAVIVALDATLVRMLLVPATMTLLGHLNWWAPPRMRRLYARYGLRH